MLKEKKSGFFDRLLTTVQEEEPVAQTHTRNSAPVQDDEEEETPVRRKTMHESPEEFVPRKPSHPNKQTIDYDLSSDTLTDDDDMDDLDNDGELSVDVYQTPNEIVVEAMVAGVRPEDLHLAITRDMITIKGKREGNTQVTQDDYFYKELYFGTFSRTIILPHEVDIEEAEAVEKHGLLIIRLPKLDKARQSKIRVKSI